MKKFLTIAASCAVVCSSFAGGIGNWFPRSVTASEHVIASQSLWSSIALSNMTGSDEISLNASRFRITGWSTENSIDLDRYLSFSVTSLGPASEIRLLGFDFVIRYSFQQQNTFTWEIRSSLDSFQSTISSVTHSFTGATSPYDQNVFLDLSAVSPLKPLSNTEFRVYGFTESPTSEFTDFGFAYLPGFVATVPEGKILSLLFLGFVSVFGYRLILRRRTEKGSVESP